jgi:Dyp-type peroxidase family
LTTYLSSQTDRQKRHLRLNKIKEDGRKQAGVEFPLPSDQPHLLIIRINLSRLVEFGHDKPAADIVRKGLTRLCGLFERIYNGEKTIDELGDDGKLQRKDFLKDYKFSATVGFGLGFFERLNVSIDKRPKHLREMPDHSGLGDPSPYNFAQTDLIIQIASIADHINRWVLENTVQAPQQQDDGAGMDAKRDCPQGIDLKPNQRCCPDGQIAEKGEKCTPDITTSLEGWATIVDVHAGFQRFDGRNLMGFNDGVSNPKPGSGSLFDDVVWTTTQDESENLKDGTYMVFQKIEHNLDQWRQLSLAQQEDWVGRTKITGLLKGTLSDAEDKILSQNLQSPNPRVREEAEKKLKELISQQRDSTERFYDEDKFKNSVPAWSHIRKANPREELIDKYKGDKNGRIGRHLIFRRGFLFVENDENNDVRSGLQFICFQRNIDNGFEFIKKNWLNNKNFPVPISDPNLQRTFTEQELIERHKHGRLTGDELVRIKNDLSKRKMLGLESDKDFNQALRDAGFDSARYQSQRMKDQITGKPTITNTQNTGREGLAGPSELGVNPTGQFLAIIPMGGGYYFVPPIPNKSLKDIGQQFF